MRRRFVDILEYTNLDKLVFIWEMCVPTLAIIRAWLQGCRGCGGRSYATISRSSGRSDQLKPIERSVVRSGPGGGVSIVEPRLTDGGLALALTLALGGSALLFFYYLPLAFLLARPTWTPSLHSPLQMAPSPPIVMSFFALSFFLFLPSVSAAGAEPIVFPDPSPEAFRALSVLVSLLGTYAAFHHSAFL